MGWRRWYYYGARYAVGGPKEKGMKNKRRDERGVC